MSFSAVKKKTTPIEGQKPGTSGLRKKTKQFMSENFVENFVQATFSALGKEELKGNTIVVGGDGRFFNDQMTVKIIQMAIANGLGEVVVGKGGLLSTPAVSALIRRFKGGLPSGGFILTASHNPGGPEEDCGIKYNVANGGPAPASITNAIFEITKTIDEYFIAEGNVSAIDLSTVGSKQLTPDFTLTVVDPTEVYVETMKEVFDFNLIKEFLGNAEFKFTFDAMNGIAGPYALAVFSSELGIDEKNLANCKPLPDFGGLHPDPNLTYASNLVAKMGLNRKGERLEMEKAAFDAVPDFGAACDGDADRNMILGKGFFVSPSDSVAIIASFAEKCIPFFKDHGGLKALARSMPTSGALDRVAEKLGVQMFEVPTGWKYFGNLMDAQELTKDDKKLVLNPLICGEESFGTGSDHVREKDGIWAVLAWLSILAFKSKTEGKLVSVEDIVTDHWKTYGRNFYSRFDYENVEKPKADAMMEALTKLTQDLTSGSASKVLDPSLPDWEIAEADIFEYTDPVDGSVAKNQGWRFLFTNGSRFVFRLSGTGSVGATIRLYLEKYDQEKIDVPVAEALKDLVTLALQTSKLEEFTGRSEPTVIT